MNTVVLKKCEQYNVELIKTELLDSIELIGGLDQYIKPDETVLLKVNLLMKKKT